MDEYIKREDALKAITYVGTAEPTDIVPLTLLTAQKKIRYIPTADVAPRAEVIEEYRKKVYAKMGKYTVMGREYIQRIMREVEKEMKGGERDEWL